MPANTTERVTFSRLSLPHDIYRPARSTHGRNSEDFILPIPEDTNYDIRSGDAALQVQLQHSNFHRDPSRLRGSELTQAHESTLTSQFPPRSSSLPTPLPRAIQFSSWPSSTPSDSKSDVECAGLNKPVKPDYVQAHLNSMHHGIEDLKLKKQVLLHQADTVETKDPILQQTRHCHRALDDAAETAQRLEAGYIPVPLLRNSFLNLDAALHMDFCLDVPWQMARVDSPTLPFADEHSQSLSRWSYHEVDSVSPSRTRKLVASAARKIRSLREKTWVQEGRIQLHRLHKELKGIAAGQKYEWQLLKKTILGQKLGRLKRMFARQHRDNGGAGHIVDPVDVPFERRASQGPGASRKRKRRQGV